MPFGFAASAGTRCKCLSEELAKRGQALGHVESSHVRWIGKTGAKDWQLLPVILAGDWTFVTKNSVDFRGPVRRLLRPSAVMPFSLKIAASRY
jgi:hypothetical protein